MAKKGGICATCGMPNDENHPRETREFNGQKMVVNVHPELKCSGCGLPKPKKELYAENPFAKRCAACGFYYIDLSDSLKGRGPGVA